MLKEVQMPKLGQTVETAVIETWHRQEGEAVAKGEPLLDITTDKATLEVEAYIAGTVRKLLYAKGATVPVNAVIALVGEPSDEVGDEMVEKLLAANAALAVEAETAAAVAAPQTAPAATASPAPAPAPTPAPAIAPPGRIFSSPRARRVAGEKTVPLQVLRGSGPNGRVVEADVLAYAERLAGLRISPTARVLAAERGVDLTRLKGSGIDGRIMKDDVLAAPVAAAPRAAAGQRVPLTAMRRIVAERMTFSKTTTPHFYLTADADMTATVEVRGQLNERGGTKVSFNDLIIRACSIAFGEVPEMNVAWADGALLFRSEVNIGLAVALDEGLIVPVVRHCEARSLEQIAQASAALIEKARNKHLTPDDYEGGGFTLSNLGMFGIDTVAPIINPGEVAILGVGRIAPRPVVVDGGIHVRQMTTLVLAADHRIVDGAIAARFLKTLKDALEAPEGLA